MRSRVACVAALGLLLACESGGSATGGTSSSSGTSGSSSDISTTEGGSTTTDPTTTGTSSTGDGTTTGAGESSSSGGPPAPTYDVHYMGRFELSEGMPRSTWSGSTARTRIDGSGVSIGLDGPAGIHFQVAVDGVPTSVFVTDAGPQSYVVASDLAPGVHDVEVVRRNEGYFGIVTYAGFELGADTSFVQTPWPYGQHIEFIGDSLTAGYGIECASGEKDFSAPTQSAYASYAMVAGRILEASVHLIAFSGKGVLQNYGGNTDEPMSELWTRTFTGQAEPQWDWASRPADVVVVNLGTNDFSAPIDAADFTAAYVALLTDVRTRYPDAAIVSVTWASWGAEREGWVTEALAQFGDANVSTQRFEVLPEEGWGCDFHTNVVTNQRFGEQLAEHIAGL